MKSKNKRLSASDYWELRCTMEEMKTAELNRSREMLSVKLLEKDIELQQLTLKLRRKNLSQVNNQLAEAKKEYERYKEALEKKIKVSLDDKSIDPITYELHALE